MTSLLRQSTPQYRHLFSTSSVPFRFPCFGYRNSVAAISSSHSLSTAVHQQIADSTSIIPDSGPIAISDQPSATTPILSGKPPPPPVPEKARPQLRATKAALNLTPSAIQRLHDLLSGPTPRFIRIGVRTKGCAGMSYHLEYVDKPAKFDEVVEQDGVKVLIDSKALFSIIGSEMDWVSDRLSSKFAFKNPNIKDACGCGESFNI